MILRVAAWLEHAAPDTTAALSDAVLESVAEHLVKATAREVADRQDDAMVQQRNETALLAEIEWSGSVFGRCPACGADESDGHRLGCQLAAALEGVKR